jgi:aspartyl-tRNA(Asn)/glutamyl-tRNA(Gln) amidotransferase subunit A
MAIAWSIHKLGPMARSAEDCGIVLSVIAGHDPQDYDSLPSGVAEFKYTAEVKSHAKPIRIGRLTNVWREMDPGLDIAINDALRCLRKTAPRSRT